MKMTRAIWKKSLLNLIYIRTVFVGGAVCLFSISAFAQVVTYLDENYKPAAASNYTYKRVFKYKEPIINPNLGTGYYGGITVNPQLTGLHYCTVTDYYRTGEIALVGTVVAGDVGCTRRGTGFTSQVIAYYKDGTIKRKEPWQSGELNGTVIFYDENGREMKRVDYVKGKMIEEGKFAVSADSPIVGTWQHVEYLNNESRDRVIGSVIIPPTILRTSTYVYSQNGVVESIHESRLGTTNLKGNWKYIPKSASSGILEEYQGEDLIERGTVKWLDRNKLEYTITFSQNADFVGKQYVWTRK